MRDQNNPVPTLPNLGWHELPSPQKFFLESSKSYDLAWLDALGVPVSDMTFVAHDMNPNLASPLYVDGKLTLRDPGLYVGRSGCHAVLFVCMPSTDADKVGLSFQFIGNYVTGAPPDPVLNQPDMRPVLSALMLAPRLMDLNCGPSSLLVMSALFCMGVYARRANWANTKEVHPYRQYHVTLDAFLADQQCWQMIDVHNGLLLKPGFSSVAFLRGGYPALQENLIQTIPKDFYRREDYSGYNDSARVLVILVRDVGYVSPLNPFVSEAVQRDFIKFCGATLQIVPMERFLTLAGYV